MTRKERRQTLSEHNDPINYTCGRCMQVHKFNSETPYECLNQPKEEDGISQEND